MAEEEEVKLDEPSSKEDKTTIFQRVSEDPTFLENVRTISIILVAFALPAIYWGYTEQFDLRALLTFDIGALAFITFFDSFMLWLEFGKKAEKQAYDLVPKLKNLKEDNDQKREKITKNFDLAQAYIDRHNEDEQEKANKLKKTKKKNKLKRKIIKAKIKGKVKKVAKLEIKLQRIEENDYYAWRKWNGKRYYKPVEIGKLTTATGGEDVVITGQDSISYSSSKDGAAKFFILGFFKYFGIGATGSMPFVIREDAKTILLFYSILFTTLFITSISRYIKVRFKALPKIIKINMNANILLTKICDYIDSVKVIEELEINN